mgnify:CR=1 FL=1
MYIYGAFLYHLEKLFYLYYIELGLEITAIKIKLPEIAILINDNNITNQRYFLLNTLT